MAEDSLGVSGEGVEQCAVTAIQSEKRSKRELIQLLLIIVRTQKTNTDSIPSDGESTDQVDYSYMPSDVLQDLCAICAKTDISNAEKWSLYCKMMQSYDHLSENQKTIH